MGKIIQNLLSHQVFTSLQALQLVHNYIEYPLDSLTSHYIVLNTSNIIVHTDRNGNLYDVTANLVRIIVNMA